MKPEDTFQNRLSAALRIRNVKPVELHEKTGISESLLSKYLSGNAIARQKKLSILSEALDINPVWLMGYDVPMTNQDSSSYASAILIVDDLFSKRLTELIEDNNCILSDIEKFVGKTTATISRYASGEIQNVKRSTIIKLADFFNVNPAWLAGFSEEKYVIVSNSNQSPHILENEYDSNSMELLNYYKKLNNLGREKALENIKDLTEIQKYVEKKTNIQEAK